MEAALALLMANPFGCQVATQLAAREPEPALGLVLNGPTVDPTAHSAPASSRA